MGCDNYEDFRWCTDEGVVEMSGRTITGEIFAHKSFMSMLDEDVVQSNQFLI